MQIFTIIRILLKEVKTIMTRDELIEKIDQGSDIMFDVANRHFSIFTWCDMGIGIGEQEPHADKMEYFKTPKELVDSYKINGVPLGSLAERVIITDYT